MISYYTYPSVQFCVISLLSYACESGSVNYSLPTFRLIILIVGLYVNRTMINPKKFSPKNIKMLCDEMHVWALFGTEICLKIGPFALILPFLCDAPT